MNITITHKPKATIGKFVLQVDGETIHVSNSIHPSELLQLLDIQHQFTLVTE
jgi:hypothetical protein